MIYCQSKKEETRIAHYNNTTTIGEVLNAAYPELIEKLICDIKTKRIIDKIDYLYLDCVFHGGENPYEVLVKDFIAKYPECKKEGLLCYTDIGGFGSPIDTIMELWQEIERFARDNPVIVSLLGAAITQALSRLKKWVLRKKGKLIKMH